MLWRHAKLFLCVKHWLKQWVPKAFFTVKMWKLRHWHFLEMPPAGVVEMGAVCFIYLFLCLENTRQDKSSPPTLILLIRQDRRRWVFRASVCSSLPFLCEHLRGKKKQKNKATQHHSVQTSVLTAFALPQCAHGAFNCLKTRASYLKTMHCFDEKSSFENVAWKREHRSVPNYSSTLLNVHCNRVPKKKCRIWY